MKVHAGRRRAGLNTTAALLTSRFREAQAARETPVPVTKQVAVNVAGIVAVVPADVAADLVEKGATYHES